MGYLIIIAKRLVIPPLCLFLLGGLGWLVGRRWPRPGRAMVWTAVGSGFLLCLPWVASALLMSLQGKPPLDLRELPREPRAIVVLGADSRGQARELGRPDVGAMTLSRLRFGAALARATDLPLAVTGGTMSPRGEPLGQLMARVLDEEYGLEARFVEDRAKTTRENAELLAPMLRAAGIERVFLVSHAWHLPRASAAFERVGLQVVPASMGYQDWPEGVLRGLAPSAASLRTSSFAIHEWLGRAWYALAPVLGR